MSKAGKLVKDMVKAKKESVMGKLGDSPYNDPMEPWSVKYNEPIKYNQPVKEETLNEDGLLMKYIRSLGFNPEFMTFAQRSSYARSNAFKRYKQGHTFDREKQNLKQEEQENVSEAGFVDVSHMSSRDIQRMGHADDDEEPVRRSYNKPVDHPHAVHINGRKWKTFGSQSHATNVAKKIKGATVHREEVEIEEGIQQTLRKVVPGYAKREIDKKMDAGKFGKTDADKDANFQRYKKIQDKLKNEETEQLDEAGTGLLMSFIKSKGLNPLTMDGNQKKAYARSSEFRIFKMRHMKETSGMGERGDDWNEEKKPKVKKVQEEADAKDTVCMDIPLLIRVLEFTREDMKTDIELHNMVERLIDMRHEVPLTMDNYDAITGKLKEEVVTEMDKSQTPPGRDGSGGDPDAGKKQYYAKTITPKQTSSKASEILKKALKNAYKKEDISEEQIDELSSDLLGRYKKAASDQASAADKAGDYDKGNKRFSGIMKATKKQFDNDAKKVNELKKMPDNMDGDDHITREEKKMKGADPCWKGYQMVGTKKKGGRTVPNCVPEEVVQEGIGGIEDSSTSATNSVKAMESEQRKKNMKSARIIKSIYKKKAKNETTYDWEKDDKPSAKVTLQGGTTMTGKPRDTVEIEPVLKTRPNSQKQ